RGCGRLAVDPVGRPARGVVDWIQRAAVAVRVNGGAARRRRRRGPASARARPQPPRRRDQAPMRSGVRDAADFPRPLAVLECGALAPPLEIVPLLRMALADAADVAVMVGQPAVAVGAAQVRWRIRRRRGRTAPVETAQDLPLAFDLARRHSAVAVTGWRRRLA